MATKTIAVEDRVYSRLARLKQESESFSKLLDRLVDAAHGSHTVAGVLAQLDRQPALPAKDAAALKRVVRENRQTEQWPVHDLS